MYNKITIEEGNSLNKTRPWKSSGFKLTGAIDRFIVFLGNLSLGSFVSHYLLSFREFRSLESSLISFFVPIAEKLSLPSEVLAYLPMVFLVSQAIVFFTTLAFGRGLFEMIARIENSGPWWWQRVGGGAKAIIDIFMAPLFVFDLPLLFKLPSLKERLLGSFSIVPHQGAPLRLLLIVPLFFIFTLLAPLMTNLELLEGSPVTLVDVKSTKLEGGRDFSKFQEISSDLFHFKSFTSFGEGDLWPLPDYDRVRARRKKKISPTLLIYDQKNKNFGHWRIKKQISLLGLLSLGRRGNPLFAMHFPHLNSALDLMKANPNAFAKKDALSSERLDDLFSPALKKEISKFFKVSFELGPKELIGHTLTYGPFIRGFIEVRQALLGLLPRGARAEVDLVKLGNHAFLRFRQAHQKGSVLGKSVIESYLPIETEHAIIFEMGWDSSLSGALSAKSFRESVLAEAQWFFDYKNLFTERLNQGLDNAKRATALYILDLLVERELKNKEKDLLEKMMYRFYFDICRQAIKDSEIDLFDLVKDNFSRISSFIEYRNSLVKERGKSYFSPLFTKKWKELWNGLRLKEKDFFEKEKNRSLDLSERVSL